MHAGVRAPLRRLVGVSAGRSVRAFGALRPAGGPAPLHRARACSGHRRAARLGRRPFSGRRARTGPLRRHPPVRTRRPARGRAPGLEDPDLQLRPARGARIPHRQRPLLDRGSRLRRHPRRRRRLDALPRLQPRTRPVGAQPPRRQGKSRSGGLPAPPQRGARRVAPAGADDRRGIDQLAGRVATDRRRRPGFSLQMEHGLDERHPALHRARPGAPALSPERTHLRPSLRVRRTVHPAGLARRSGARQGLAIDQDARRPLAALRERAPVSVIHVCAPGQEIAVHGLRIRPGTRMESRPEPRLAPARRPRASRRAVTGARPQSPASRAARAA